MYFNTFNEMNLFSALLFTVYALPVFNELELKRTTTQLIAYTAVVLDTDSSTDLQHRNVH